MLNFLKKLAEDLKAESQASEQSADLAIEPYCFALMAIIANADANFDEREKTKILSLGQELYGLSGTEASSMLEEAKNSAGDATSLYEFTSEIHKFMSEQDKFRLVTGLWQIAFADGEVDRYEEHIIRRIADLIYLDHARFTEARHAASQQQS